MAEANSPHQRGPNCWDCRFLKITWDQRHPYACQYMGFQSRILPCLEVLRADGRACSAFSAKQATPTAPAVGQPSNRRDSQRSGPLGPINLIT